MGTFNEWGKNKPQTHIKKQFQFLFEMKNKRKKSKFFLNIGVFFFIRNAFQIYKEKTETNSLDVVGNVGLIFFQIFFYKQKKSKCLLSM